MGMKVTVTGDFKNTRSFLMAHRKSLFSDKELIKIAERGLDLFRQNTPKSSGKTAYSWFYEIVTDEDSTKSIIFHNSNIQNGLNIAILIDTGHGTAQGKWVPGTHYIDETIDEICSYINKRKI